MPRIGHAPLVVTRPRRGRKALLHPPTRIVVSGPCRCSDCAHLIRIHERAWAHSGGVACGMCGLRFDPADAAAPVPIA